MTTVVPPLTCLNFVVVITQEAASALGSNTTNLPCKLYIADTPIGFQWQVCYQAAGAWQLMSVPPYAGAMYADGEIPGICAEINSVGLVSWIMRQASWFNSLMVSFFTGKVPGSQPTPPPSGEVTPVNFMASVNNALLTMGARDTNGDGIPELVMA